MKFAVRKVVALLLAMLMLVSSMASFAEGTVEYSDTVSSYTLNPDADAADEAIQEVYDEYIAELKAMTSYADRYAWLYSAKYEPASDLGDYFYADFIAYYNEKEPTGDAMCVCAEPLVYGADGHTEGCRWNINNLVTVPGASASSGSASVSGDLPAGATLSASSKSTPAAFTGLFEADKGAYTDTQYNSYDLKIMVGDQQWQPGSKVAVTLSNVWSGEGTPAVYVYHFIDVASAIDPDCIISYDSALVSAYPEAAAAANEKGYANAVAYEVFSTIDGTATYNSNNVSFSLDSFSNVVVVSTGMESYYQLLYTFISREETMQGVSDYLATGKSVGAEKYYNETYAGFVEWCKANYPDGITLCTCTTFVYDENGAVIDCPPYQYDTTAHDATCPWHSDNLNKNILQTVTSGNGVAVRGNLPEGAILEANEKVVEAASAFIDEEMFDAGNIDYKVFDIKIKVNDVVWQPDDSVRVTLQNAFSAELENPVIAVYHIFDTAEAINNAASYLTTSNSEICAAFPEAVAAAETAGVGSVVAYEVITSKNGEVAFSTTGVVSFDVDSFSNFVVVSGSTSTLGSIAEDGESHVVYMAPSATANFKVNGTINSVTGNINGITATYSGNTVSISTSNAEVGASTNVDVTWDSDKKATIKVIVVTADKANKLNVWNGYRSQRVILTLKTDGDIPGEPADHSSNWGGYRYYNGSYVSASAWNWPRVHVYSETAIDVIDPNIIFHEKFKENNNNASNSVAGIALESGTDPKAMVSGVDWDAFLIAAAKENKRIYVSGTTTTIKSLYDTHRDEITKYYEVQPYVVKYETEDSLWHIDCVVVPIANVELVYSLNIPSNLTIPSGVSVPDTVSVTKGTSVPVGSVSGLSNGKMSIPIPGTTNRKYEFTFLYWSENPDGTGTKYDAGESSIKVEKDTVLYAIWDTNPAIGTGNLTIRKIVSASNADSIDETEEFNFVVNIYDENGNPSTTIHEFEVFEANNVAAGISGNISDGGKITLKHGQYAVIYDLPAINAEDGAANITVKENADSSLYTISWTGGKTSENPAKVKIEGGRHSILTCTNTKATPKVEVDLKKIVDGNIGDRNKVFTFTVTSSDGRITSENGTFTIKHGQTVKLPAVEVGATITIVESSAGYDTKASTTNISNAVTKVDVKQNSDKMTATLDPIMVTNDLSLITVTNTKDITVDTGILLDSAPYVLLLALVGAGIAFMIIRRRRRED